MSSDVIWSGPARSDLLQILAWYMEQADEDTGQRIADMIFAATDRLGTFPNYGPTGDVPCTREIVLPDLPYVVIYRVVPSRVEILRVLHTRRDRSQVSPFG